MKRYHEKVTLEGHTICRPWDITSGGDTWSLNGASLRGITFWNQIQLCTKLSHDNEPSAFYAYCPVDFDDTLFDWQHVNLNNLLALLNGK